MEKDGIVKLSDEKDNNAYSPEHEVAAHPLLVIIIGVDVQLVDHMAVFSINLIYQMRHENDVYQQHDKEIEACTEVEIGARSPYGELREREIGVNIPFRHVPPDKEGYDEHVGIQHDQIALLLVIIGMEQRREREEVTLIKEINHQQRAD